MLLRFGAGIVAIAIIGFVILWAFLMFDKVLSRLQKYAAFKYIKLRTKYYKYLLKSEPNNKILADKYRRSENHFNILSIQHFMGYLTDKDGCFEICPLCKLPKEPNVLGCSNCGKIEDKKFNQFWNKYMEQ